jgi:two-component system response regulator AlgR
LKKAAAGARVTREVLERMDPHPRRFFSVAERGRVTLVPVADVLYLKAELKYVTLRTREREYLIEDPLVALEKEFGERFVRIHRNCLVARAAVRGFERGGEGEEAGWMVVLDGLAERLPVSRRQWPGLRELAAERP